MHVLLADDHDLVRDGIKFLLRKLADDVAVSEARTFHEALERASRAEDLSLIMLDLYMPGMNGFAGLSAMRRQLPDVPVVMLSSSVRKSDALNAIEQGASGYIPKTLGGSAMVSALHLVLAGETFLPSFILKDDEACEVGAYPVPTLPTDNPLRSLTKREREVLGLLAQCHSNKEIARQLDLQEITIKIHLKNVFRKLGALNRTQAVKIAMQLGMDA
jgi:two-component system nitrate/nitrite response regulator NarL